MYSKNTLNSGMSSPSRINLPPMNSTHSLPHPPPLVPLSFQQEEAYSKKTTSPYYPYKLPALHENSSPSYSYPSTSSSSSSSYYYAQQHHHTYSVEQSSVPSSSSTLSSLHSRQQLTAPPSTPPLSQLPTSHSRLSHSPSGSSAYQQEKTYHPIYQYQEPTVKEEEIQEKNGEDIQESSSMKRKREMTERMQEINREFTDNNEVLYREKLKQLQQELSAVEQGQHDIFNESIADLEEKRRETIQNAKLIMFYQISSVDHDCHLNYQLVEEESLAERSELQKAMFLILDEKRKRFKEMKDGELEPLSSGVQKRILRKRGESETPLSKLSKRKSDRSKENVGQLLNALNINDEEELEADLRAMRAHVAKSNNKMKR